MAALAPAVLAASAGCRGGEPTADGAAIEAVDVGEPIDSQIRPEEDERAEVRARGLLGVLPGDFPSDLWVYEPASIVDFGAAEPGRSYIALRTVAAPAEVSRRFQAEERKRGWQVAVVASTLLTFSKDGRLVEAELEQRGNETWIRIEYPSG
ncbi:MAG TPA: hypothetical protein VMS86_05090 [Thermoanaerobaculia bacterium]|nr:hypothetical protein [Thermoanaerobaculia bacterium]